MGLVGQPHSGQRGDLRAPRAGGEHHRLAGDAAAVGHHLRARRPPETLEPGHAVKVSIAHAALLRRLRVAPQERPGKDDAVVWVEGASSTPFMVSSGTMSRAPLGREDPGLRRRACCEARRSRSRRSRDLRAPREEEVAALPQPDVDPHLASEAASSARWCGGRARCWSPCPTASALRRRCARWLRRRGSPSRAPPRRCTPQLGEVVGQRQPHDPAADDDHLGPRGSGLGGAKRM